MNALLLKSILIFTLAILPTSHAASYKTCNEQTEGWRDVSGEWVASVGPVILQTNDLHVTGVYNKDTWSLDLYYTPDRKHLHGRWSHRNGLEGPVIFHLNSSGCIQHARWGGAGNAVCNEHNSAACIHDWAFHGKIENRLPKQ